MKRFVMFVLSLIAIVLALPVFAGGPGNGDKHGEDLRIGVKVNGVPMDINTFNNMFNMTPGTVFTPYLYYIGGKGGPVPPPVQPHGWDLLVRSAPGVVAPYRGRSPHKQQQYIVRREGFVFLFADGFSGDVTDPFSRIAKETIKVSSQPAPQVSLGVHADMNAPDGIITVDINTNVRLTEVRVYVRATYGTLDVNLISDQGATWTRLTLSQPYSMEYTPGSTVLYLQNGPADQTVTLPDGIMSTGGIALPVPIGPTGHGIQASLGCMVKLSKG